MSRCDACGIRKAVVYQPHTGRKLCKECFFKDIESRVMAEIRKYKLLKENDKVALAVSGGKDSFVLLDIMSRIHDPAKLFAITIIEGIHGYNRDEYIQRVKGYGRERGVDVIVTSFKEYIGKTLDEIVSMAQSRRLNISPCTFCGALRRRIINYYARLHGATKTATAHNLDDEAQTSLMNILRGDIIRLLRQHPLAPSFSSLFIKRIKPLRRIYEWETTMYAYLKSFEFPDTECPYLTSNPTLRLKVRKYLQQLELEKPGTLLKILDATDILAERLIHKLEKIPPLPRCKICGEPTSHGREICKVCELLISIGLNPEELVSPRILG